MAEVITGRVPQETQFGPDKPYLLILNGSQAETTLVLDNERLKERPLIMGRGGSKAKMPVDFVLQDPSNRASAVHASISWREDDAVFLLTDLGSSNGTRLNEHFIAGPTPLFPGDLITCGTLEMLLMLPDSAGETGYAHPIQRKRGKPRWELLEDGEPGIARLEVIENTLRGSQGQSKPPRIGSFCRLTPKHPFYIGRYDIEKIDLQVLDDAVSRRHVEIRWTDNSYIISDMGAANPALVNDQLLTAPRRLNEGDEIVIGQVVLRFRASRRPYAAPLEDLPASKSDLEGGLLRLALSNRKLALGPEAFRLPINRQILVGRADSNDLRLYDASVSRRHARISVENNRFVVTDIGSANGTKVNEQEIGGPTILQPGDKLKIGDFVFDFEEVSREIGPQTIEDVLEIDSDSDEADYSQEITLDSTSKPKVRLPQHPLLEGEPLTLELGEASDTTNSSSRISKQNEVINHPLRAIPPFDEMDGENFKLLSRYFKEVYYKSGQEITREGQGRGAFFVILDGQVIISRALEQGRSRLVLGELGPGTVYGERTIFADQPFANRLQAKTPVRALVLEEAIFVREFSRNRTIVSFFQQQVSINSAANWLKGTLLMQTLSDKTRQSLAGRLRYRVFAAGETLAKKGEPCDEFFLVVGGAARAFSVDKKGGEESLTILEEGDTFGDGIAAPDETYPMTVRAERLVECYILARADFQNVLQKSGDPIASLSRGLSGLPLGAVLNRIPPFNTMPPQLVAQIGSHLKTKFFKKGEVIAWQGNQSIALYIIRSGQVQMSYKASDGTQRKDAKLGPGQFFGEASLLRETVHAATVTAVEDCELLTLFRNKLDEVMALGEGYNLGQYFARSLERRFRPKRVANYRITEQPSADGEIYYVLNDESGEKFFRLSERGYFLWQRMNGDNTISDLALDYFMEYKVLDLEAVSNTVGQLQAAGFLQVPAVNQSLMGKQSQRKTSRLTRVLTYRYEIPNIDNLVDKLYRFGGQFFFLKPVQWLMFALFGAGLLSFFYFGFFDKSAGDASFLLKPPVSIFSGSAWWILIVFALGSFALHEAAHALTCKSYGRKVSRGGFGWYYLGPIFYVNTDDIYLESREARIAVDLAGPFVNALTGGIFCLLMFLPNLDADTRTFFFQMASVAYLIAYININPLMELDGYYALSNWFEIPNLRKKALVFMRRKILRQPQPRPVPVRERKIFFWFALLIPVYLFVTMLQFLLWLGQLLSSLLLNWQVADPLRSWLSWGPAVLAAIILSIPLFVDLIAGGREEEEKEISKPKKKARRAA